MTDQDQFQTPEISAEDDLRAAFAELKGRDGAEANTDSGGQDAQITASADEGAKDNRSRDDQGRFAKGQTQPDTTSQDQAAQPAAEAAKPASVAAPDGLTEAERTAFEKADPVTKAAFSRRVKELLTKVTSQDEERSFGRKIKEIATPYMAVINSEGSSVEAAFSDLMRAAYVMRQGTPQQKLNILVGTARTYGVDLTQAIQQPHPGQAQHPAIETLQQRLDRIEQERKAENISRQQREDAAVQSEIGRFAQEPGHEHFETVKALMGTLMTGGHATSLQDAYDQACHAHPEVRSTLAAAQEATRNEQQLAANAAKADAARRAAGSVTGGPGSLRAPANANTSAGSPEDDVRAAIRSLSGRY